MAPRPPPQQQQARRLDTAALWAAAAALLLATAVRIGLVPGAGPPPPPPPAYGRDPHARIAVVVPFVAHEQERLEANLARWADAAPPCTDAAAAGRADLYFLYHRTLDTEADRVHALRRALQPARGCFGQVSFLSARLTDAQDTYPAGAGHMFFWMARQPRLRDAYAAVYLMEADNVPCRAGWLDRLCEDATVGPPFWMKGSVRRDGNEAAAQSSFADHLNGNALYALGDPAFRDYLARVEAALAADPCAYLSSYDIALHLVRRDRALTPVATYAATQHLFVASPTSQNWYRTPVNATELCQQYPDTFLVHGRHIYW